MGTCIGRTCVLGQCKFRCVSELYLSLGTGLGMSIELHPRKRKKDRTLTETEDLVVAPPRAFSSSGYSLANMTECVVDVDRYESTYL